MKFGLELEYTLRRKGKLIFPGDEKFDTDGFPLLGELRATPSCNPFLAVSNMQGLIAQAKHNAKKLGLTFHLDPMIEVPKDIAEAVKRRGDLRKEPMKELHMAPHMFDWSDNVAHAGLHIHFSGKERSITVGCERCGNGTHTFSIYGQLPIPLIIARLDGIFANDIAEAERNMGAYEMKPYGFEYRSLPANINLARVAEALNEMAFLKESCYIDDLGGE